ncbi:hypothetical protein SLOPH_2330 [Spraguea lophii 42_110]|uniref:Ubiquitin-like domain-containing protein n=1 Tax=Spraguea lophii (strain 42_110) TaxID=1358809 RepID=S7XFU9_SPRLO|nr:hypothetical protein SLOPH_2330 [Spraguea lophii 42_110]
MGKIFFNVGDEDYVIEREISNDTVADIKQCVFDEINTGNGESAVKQEKENIIFVHNGKIVNEAVPIKYINQSSNLYLSYNTTKQIIQIKEEIKNDRKEIEDLENKVNEMENLKIDDGIEEIRSLRLKLKEIENEINQIKSREGVIESNDEDDVEYNNMEQNVKIRFKSNGEIVNVDPKRIKNINGKMFYILKKETKVDYMAFFNSLFTEERVSIALRIFLISFFYMSGNFAIANLLLMILSFTVISDIKYTLSFSSGSLYFRILKIISGFFIVLFNSNFDSVLTQ